MYVSFRIRYFTVKHTLSRESRQLPLNDCASECSAGREIIQTLK